MGIIEEPFEGPELVSPNTILAEHVEALLAIPAPIGKEVDMDPHFFVTFRGIRHDTGEVETYPVAMTLDVATNLAKVTMNEIEHYNTCHLKQQPSSDKPQED